MEQKYNLRYEKINKRTINVVRHFIFDAKPWVGNKVERLKKFDNLLKELSDIYNINKPSIVIKKNVIGNGAYSVVENKIYMSKISVVTLLHEFKHAIQFQKHKTNTEKAARGWSVSLFYLASPKHYQKAVEKGLLLFT